MRFEDSDDARLRIVPRKGVARGVSRERVPWISFYEDVQIFLSTPFETLPDQKFPGATGRTNLKIFLGGVHIGPIYT